MATNLRNLFLEIVKVRVLKFLHQIVNTNHYEQIKNSIQKLDYNKICRFCLSEGQDEMTQLFEEHYFKIVQDVIPHINFDDTDGLPKLVCRNCIKNTFELYCLKWKISGGHTLLEKNVENKAAQKHLSCDSEEHNEEEEEKCDVLSCVVMLLQKKSDSLDTSYKHNAIKAKTNANLELYDKIKNEPLQDENRQTIMDDVHIKTTEKAVLCSFCDESFTDPIILKSHVRIIHKGKQFYCQICSKNFKRKSDCQEHEITHTYEISFVCEICSNAFVTCNNLRLHQQLIHNMDEEFWCCEICKELFIHSSSLKDHYLVHSDLKPFSCNMCDKAYSDGSELKEHQQVHCPELNLFSCEICSKGFTQLLDLVVHYARHTGESPFICNECSCNLKTEYEFEGPQTVDCGMRICCCEIRVCSKMYAAQFFLELYQQNDIKKKPLIDTDEKPCI